MSDYNQNSRLKAWKALTIVFIAGIVIVNVLLIFKIVRKKKFIFEPKKLTIISLAIADIFNAMFSRVVDGIAAFHDWSYKSSCITEWVNDMYAQHLVNFVYGMGLVLLGLELTLRLFNKLPLHLESLIGSVLFSIGFGGIPWFLGIIIIIPLFRAFADFDPDTDCYSFDSSIDRYILHGVSSCLSASAALLTGILVFIRQKPHDLFSFSLLSSETQAENSTIMNREDPSTIQMQNLAIDQTLSGNSQSSHQQAANSTPSSSNPYVISLPENSLQTTNQSHPDCRVQPTTNTRLILTNFRREQLTLLFVCIVNFICVIPFNVYITKRDEALDNLELKTHYIVNDILAWLMISRSVLTPLMWIFLWRVE